MPNSTSVQPKPVFEKKQPRSFFKAVLSGLLAFLILGALLEGAFRLGWVDKILPMRSVGNFHTQFETKWFKLEDYVQQNGGVDVILVGNSMVNTGVDPEVVASRYKELTGKDVRIFNFGVEGLTVEPLSSLAQILVEKYHPGTIILFTEMRDYIGGNGDETANEFLANAWVQQQLNHPSVEGYLEEHSFALQRTLPFRYWSRADFLDTYILDARRLSETSNQGYEADRQTGENIDRLPNITDPADAEIFNLFKNYVMDPSRISDLENILAYKNQGTTIIVTEMPTYPTYYAYLENPSIQQDYQSKLEQIVKSANGYFLPTVPSELIPLTARVDNHHLNFLGAPIYSNLLAEQLADLCTTRQVCLSSEKAPVQP